jgi:hypothetical protein
MRFAFIAASAAAVLVMPALAEERVNCDMKQFLEPGSAGIVKDVTFIDCKWPPLTHPVAIFAEGSSGIVVKGNPTPRNVIFPPDTNAGPIEDAARTDVFFLKEGDFVSELPPEKVEAFRTGEADVAKEKADAVFIPINQSADDPAGKFFITDRAGRKSMTEVTRQEAEVIKDIQVEEVEK